jgi:hypothetical protein
MDNANCDMLPVLRQFTASSKARINEDVTICVSSNTFSPKFLIGKQFSTA